MFAIYRLGAIYVPCSTLYAEDELAYQFSHADVKAVVTSSNYEALASGALARSGLARTIIVCDEAVLADSLSFSELCEGQTPTMPIEADSVSVDDPAMVLYTSGTTERPRGVVFSHGNLMTAGLTAVRHFRWCEDDRYLSYLPLFHGNGGIYGVVPAIIAGASLAIVPRFSASGFGEMLVNEGATYVAVNSTHIRMIMRNPVTPFDRTHRVRRMMLGLTLSPEDWVSFEERFQTRLIGSYGLTESLGLNIVGDTVGPRRIGAAGRIIRGYSIRLIGDDGEPVSAGEPGEAILRSHQRHGLAQGYFRDPDRTADVFGDWLHTGDVLRVDPDGYIWYVSRRKDMIKRSGFNVAGAEVERVILDINGVNDVAVVGTPDVVREEAIVAFVVVDKSVVLTEDEVFSHCDDCLAEYKRPQFVEFVDQLPVNFLGKIDRRALRERALKYRIESEERAPVGRRG